MVKQVRLYAVLATKCQPLSFFKELKRRNVFKVTVIYVIVGWVLLQVADVLFSALNLPEWTVTLVAGLLIIGFPVALIFAWAFELTPDGLKKEKDVDRSLSVASQTGERARSKPTEAGARSKRRARRERIRSLVVLPLTNLSRDPEQEYFADGMTEALIADLAKLRSLRIISRTSAMRYKGSNNSLPEIAEELDVDAVLEGSVLRAGQRVRITIQLIRAATDTHLWAESYERDVQDVLLLQSEVAQAVAREIQVAVTPEEKKVWPALVGLTLMLMKPISKAASSKCKCLHKASIKHWNITI